ncbi:MAG TPA: hypothetical protein VN795_02420 [Stellaceae bacterium]|nr:hypothetical protein [Stellaceae bacterium]
MLRPLGWFRSNGGRVAWLAFFALACHFALTFGHIHVGSVSAISSALAISANGAADAEPSPALPAPTGLAQDFCAVCNHIAVASTLVLPTAPTAIAPISIARAPRWPLTAVAPASRRHFQFNARGPPDA